MSTNTYIVQNSSVATQIVWAGDGPQLITNNSDVNIFIGNNNSIKSFDQFGVATIGPLGSIAVDGVLDVYAVSSSPNPVVVSTIAGGLSISSVVQLMSNNVINGASTLSPSGDTSGASDANNLAQLLRVSSQVVKMLPGTYFFNASIILSAGQCIIADNWDDVIWKPTSAVTTGCIVITNSAASPGSLPSCMVQNITFDGTNAGIGCAAILAGDLSYFQFKIKTQNFNTAGAAGIHLLNSNFWTERCRIQLFDFNCTNGVILDSGPAGRQSFDRSNIDIECAITSDQTALMLQGTTNGPVVLSGTVNIRGNFSNTVSGSGFVVDMTCPNSSITQSNINIGVETDTGSGTGTPQTFNFVAGCKVNDCYGVIDYANGGGGAFTPSNNNANFSFNGSVAGDDTLRENTIKSGSANIITSGFPSGWTGAVSVQSSQANGLCWIGIDFSIASGTVLTNSETIVALPAWAFTGHHSQIFYTDDGSGVTYPLHVSSDGNLHYYGPSKTLTAQLQLFGQAIVSNTPQLW